MAVRCLSKSRYLKGLQCPKYLWIISHDPERIPEVDAVTQYAFDQGHRVGELAKRLFPGGLDIPHDDFGENIRQTRELLKLRKPLFEAGIIAGNIYCRPDILNPAGAYKWDIIEVKSSARVKDVNIEDVSFQRYCCEKAGLAVSRCFLMYIDSGYIRDGDIDPAKLFAAEDITRAVREAGEGIEERIEAMHEVISRDTCPEVTIGSHCSNPYCCPLYEVCRGFLPEHNVFELYQGGRKSLELFNSGVYAIRDIPPEFLLNEKQVIQRNCILEGEQHVNREEISRFLENLKYPLYFLDFETFSPAIPLFDGTGPYQAIPFQFSLHVLGSPEGRPRHHSFLAEGTADPRYRLLTELVGVLGTEGSIIVYSSPFEKGILRKLGESFPEFADWADGVCERVVDLLIPFRSFHYYHRDQRGSASLKKVLPVMTGSGYEKMEINDGGLASTAFQEITYHDVPDEVRRKVRGDLEEYCKLDTEGMTWLVKRLREISIG